MAQKKITELTPTTTISANDILIIDTGVQTYQITFNNFIKNKQDKLISGVNVKTINNESILGSGNIPFPTMPDVPIRIFKVNGEEVEPDDGTIDIDVPTKYSDLDDDIEYLTEITYQDVIDALGFTPYDEENPSNFGTGTISEIIMNGQSKGTIGSVNLGTVITNVDDKQDVLTAGDNITIEKIGDETVISSTGGGGGEPSEYLKRASVSGNTLTLTKKDNTTVEFTPQGGTGDVADVYQNGVSVVDANHIAQVTVPTDLSELTEDASHRLVTDVEKTTWSGKQDVIEQYLKDASVSSTTLTITKKDGTTITFQGGGGSGGGGTVYYGTCGTAAATAAKAVTLTSPNKDDFELETGVIVFVKFTYTCNVASPTLNVKSTGAKTIVRAGSSGPSGITSRASVWAANETIGFAYTGSYWAMLDVNYVYGYAVAPTTGTTYYPMLKQYNGTSKEQLLNNAYMNTAILKGAAPKYETTSEGKYLITEKGVNGYNGLVLGSSAKGTTTYTVGNEYDDISNCANNNSYGYLRLYGASNGYATLRPDAQTVNSTVYIPKPAYTSTSTMYIQMQCSEYAECTTAAATAAKVATVPSAATCGNAYRLVKGQKITVKFTNTNTNTAPTLNVNSTGAKSIKCYGTTAPDIWWQDGEAVEFVYDGTNYLIVNGSKFHS